MRCLDVSPEVFAISPDLRWCAGGGAGHFALRDLTREEAEFRVHAPEAFHMELWRYGLTKEKVAGLGFKPDQLTVALVERAAGIVAQVDLDPVRGRDLAQGQEIVDSMLDEQHGDAPQCDQQQQQHRLWW